MLAIRVEQIELIELIELISGFNGSDLYGSRSPEQKASGPAGEIMEVLEQVVWLSRFILAAQSQIAAPGTVRFVNDHALVVQPLEAIRCVGVGAETSL